MKHALVQPYKINERRILPKNLHPLAIILVLNFHKALKIYARSPQHYFKLPVKLIKCVSRAFTITLPDLYALYMSPPSPSSLMPKQQSLVLLETHQPAGIKESCCESGAKYDVSTPSYLVLAALRVQTQDPKRDLK